jgi:dienelactone hydrolase
VVPLLTACGGTTPRRVPDGAPSAAPVVRHNDLIYGHAPVSVDPRLAATLHRPRLAVEHPQALTLDLYSPGASAAPARPALVVLHGGGFGFGDKDDATTVDLARSFARRGYVVAAINYRLLALKYCYGASSDGLLPACYRAALAARDDAETALAWLRAHAARFGLDPHRIAVAGDSAGGIASYLVGTDGRGGDRVAAFFSLSGGVPQGRFAGPGDAPGLLAVSRGERAFAWSRDSAGALARAGVPASLDVLAGSAHDPYVADRRRLLAEASCFFSRALGTAATGAGCEPRLRALEAAARAG